MRPDRRTHVVAAGGAVAAALVGSLGTRVRTRWYRELDKPPWQPPGWVFGPAWTTLYTLGAFSFDRVLSRSTGTDRQQLKGRWAVNLALNSGWVAFATALNLEIVRRGRDRPSPRPAGTARPRPGKKL